MHRSLYNFVVRRADNRNIAFNAQTSAFIEISQDVRTFLAKESDVLDERRVKELQSSGFLVESDEVTALAERYSGTRLLNRSLNVTIAPTLRCNFSCDYCFQEPYRSSDSMTQEVADAVVAYLDRRMKDGGIESLRLTWYGGEPLLELDRILELTPRLRSIASTNKVQFRGASIVTNGELLTEYAAEALAGVGIKSAQVSLDALLYVPTFKRGAISGSGKLLSPILLNVKNALKYVDVQIRINVSRQNQLDVEPILTTLKAHGLSDKAYLARVEDADGEAGFRTMSDGSRARIKSQFKGIAVVAENFVPLTRKRFAEFEMADGYADEKRKIEHLLQKLHPKNHYCSATAGALVAFSPQGGISRCWHSVGSEGEELGSVLDDWRDVENSSNAVKWRDYSFIRYDACIRCNVLPLCMGGCSHPRVFMDAKSPPCESIKYQIYGAIEAIANALDMSEAPI